MSPLRLKEVLGLPLPLPTTSGLLSPHMDMDLLHLKSLHLKVLHLHFSDRGVLVALMGQKRWMVDHSGETGLYSGIVSQRGTGTGKETETETEREKETEIEGLVVEGVLLVMEAGAEVVIEWMEGTGSEAGEKREAITGEADGRGTEIGTETATATETENDGTGERSEAAWIATGDERGATTVTGIGRVGRGEKEAGEKEAVEKGEGGLKEKKERGQGGQNDERGPHGGTEMID